MVAARAYVKIHRSGGETIVAICDEELLGKELEEGKLRVKIDESFYGGDLVELDKILYYVKHASMANIIGNSSVRKVAEMYPGVLEAAVSIGGVLHVQVFNSKKW